MSRICIVTPDTVGPVKNGGIGTHCYNLAIYFVRLGHAVTLLFTGPHTESDKDRWRTFYQKKGVQLSYLSDFPDLPYPVQLPPQLSVSLKIFGVLRRECFDQIHFQDWLANGFHCIQAKRVLDYFSGTLLTVTAHSSTEWINEGMQQWNSARLEGSKIMWAERYCTAHCDALVSPSTYMLRWMRENRWKLSPQYTVIPYLFFKDSQVAPYAPEAGTIAFFGRLETRKGLEIFCGGLNKLSPEDLHAIHRVLFIGKEGLCGEQPAIAYINTHLSAIAAKIEFHTNLDTFAAQRLLRERRAVAFLPSLMDNLPYSGIECAVNGIPAFAADSGGFAEIFSAEQLFVPTVAGVAAALRKALHEKLQFKSPVYDAHLAESGWKELAERRSLPPASVATQPLISVCMSHYNHGAYLPEALHSLAEQDYPNFEVIVVDDGSTDAISKEVFHRLRTALDNRFRFYEKTNEGLARTRNACAETYAHGEYLVFCDADNVFEPNMLSTLANAAARSNLDIITCHCLGFIHTDQLRSRSPEYRYAPLGADLVSGLLENVFGDANFIIKKAIFLELGGFKETRNSWEDWDLLTRAVLGGKTLDVLPKPLFWYRVTGTGMTGTTSPSGNHRMVLESCEKYLPPFGYRALHDLLVPIYKQNHIVIGYKHSVIVNTLLHWGVFLEKMYGKLCPQGSIPQKLASWFRCTACKPKQSK